MKSIRFFLVFVLIGLLVGCQCPKKKKTEPSVQEGTPSITEIIEGIEQGVPGEVEEGEEVPGGVEVISEGTPTGGEELPPEGLPTGVTIEQPEGEMKEVFSNIYFDFDKYDLRPDAIERLKKIGDYLKKNSDITILIEGHCDERGTREYNLVLGEQRALSARNFLINYGISPKRLYTVSYGEDVPADPGHNEEAWAKNRRCEFKIVK